MGGSREGRGVGQQRAGETAEARKRAPARPDQDKDCQNRQSEKINHVASRIGSETGALKGA
jgi:hypothetical protein